MSIPAFPLALSSDEIAQQLIELSRRAVDGVYALSRVREADVAYGVTPKSVVYQDGLVTLYRYTPRVEQPLQPPILITYALVNRPYMIDLQQDRSLVSGLLDRGLDVYLIDWGYPQRNDRWLTLDDYINGYIDTCVDIVRDRHQLDKINLLGVCQGGTFSLCYTALHQEKVKALITTVTPVDFHATRGLLNIWSGCSDESDPDCLGVNVDLMVEAMGNVSSDFMNFGFLMLKPFELGVQKYVDLIDLLPDRERALGFLRMEYWVFNSPDLAGEAYREFIKHFYQQNKLIKGQIEIGGRAVDLRRLTLPMLNIWAEHDHLVPAASAKALKAYVGARDFTERSYPVGHIGMYVSRKVQDVLAPSIAEWLRARA
jgi:polyhydroxyalkanoate synthase